MNSYYIVLVVLYFILSILNVTSIGPLYTTLRKKLKENDDWVNMQREGKDRDKPRYVSMEYRYITLLTFVLIPFYTLAKNNKLYIVRLLSYLSDVVYGGLGSIIWLFISLTKNILDMVSDVFLKLKDL